MVLEQSGRVLAFPNTPESQSGETSEFLNLTDRLNRGGNEEGLLGLAFHPQYEGNGRFFVYYSASDPRRSVLSEFSAEPGGTADHSSERVVMEIEQPYSNHNGGMLAFGPDGHLYVGLGDGGAGGDPQDNGQDPMTLLGSILRIDVDGARPYEIPADNPFVGGNGGAPEVWAYGLRNPWRFAFEPNSSALWVADVGQNRYEEVSRVQAGRNYGWNVMEGPSCYGAGSCDRDGLELPVAWYDHGDGCSVTGGYVNRDPLTPALNGSFIFADYCSGTVWRVNEEMDDGLEELVDTDLNISSFGEMSDGSLYIVAAGRGAGIYRLAKRD